MKNKVNKTLNWKQLSYVTELGDEKEEVEKDH